MLFHILRGEGPVGCFIETVRRHADENKKSLGFLPEAVYSEAALSNKLLVAVRDRGGTQEYAGHILYGGTFPHARIFQVYVAPQFRRQRVASLLVDTVTRDAEQHGYLSVSARVATDLKSANDFWKSCHFDLIRSKSGGASRSRTIGIRVRDLDTPRLFPSAPLPVRRTSFRLSAPLLPSTPTYLIDVNVFLDLVKSRQNAASVQRFMAAFWTRIVDVFVSEEFVNELRRASVPNQSDPIVEFAATLPRLPNVPPSVLDQLVVVLGPLVFPARSARGNLSRRDRSDLAHIATAIHHKADGFITGERSILKRASALRTQFGLDIVGTDEFAAFVEPVDSRPSPERRSGTRGDELHIGKLREESRTRVEEFITLNTGDYEFAQAALSPGAKQAVRQRICVESMPSSRLVGYASWDLVAHARKRVNAYLVVDEAYPDAEPIAIHLLRELAMNLAAGGPCIVDLAICAGHLRARSAAIEVGFRALGVGPGSVSRLHKLVVGGAITTQNWSKLTPGVRDLAGVCWTGSMPEFCGPETSMVFENTTGETLNLTLREAESVIGPVLFLLPKRPGILVPIRRNYAEHLFTGSLQMPLFPRGNAVLSTERVYFRAPSRARMFSIGSVVVFYESLPHGGRGCAFAAAVVVSNRVVWAETLPERVFTRGVLGRDDVLRMSKEGLISVLHFDSVISLPKPVPLARLRALGCVDDANLVAPRALEPDTLASLLSEAKALVL